MSGYVRIHRSLIGHPAFRNDAEAMVFAWLVARAAWKPTRVRYKGRPISLNRGQLAISVRDLAFAMDRDKAWIERLLKRLRAETMVETQHETGINVVTICNYSEYQSDSNAGETPRKTGARQAQDTEQVREKGKKEISEANASSVRDQQIFEEKKRAIGSCLQTVWRCPEGVDPAHWRDFRRNRKTRRLTDSETAYAGQLKALVEIADDEWPPGRLVQHAAEKGWGTINDPRTSRHGQSTSNVTSLRGSRPDPALDLYRAACAAEDREDNLRAGPSLPALGSGGP